MPTLPEIRKELKALGYKISIKTLSHGPHATFETLDGDRNTGNAYSPESLAKWEKLFAWQQANKARLVELKAATGIYGLVN